MTTAISKISGVPNRNNIYSAHLVAASSQGFSIADHADFDPTGNFTAGFWLKTSGISMGLWQSEAEASSKLAGWGISIDAAGKIYFFVGKNTGVTHGTDYQDIRSTNAINDGAWHWIVCTSDGSNLNIYVDGSSGATPTAWTGGQAYQSPNYIRIGLGNDTGSDYNYLSGNMDEVFIIKGTAWDLATIQSYYQKVVTGATNLTAYYRFENNHNDSSGNSHTLTDIGSPTFQTDVPFDPSFISKVSSVKNLGNNIYSVNLVTNQAFSLADTSDLKPTSAHFTVGAWFKTIATGSIYIFESGSESTNRSGIKIYLLSNGKIQFESGRNTGSTQGTDYQQIVSNVAWNDGLWHWLVAVWDGSNLNLYIDGSVAATAVSWSQNVGYEATNYIRVGCASFSGSNTGFWNGSLDEVFFLNGTGWNSTQVSAFYKKFISDTNLKAYWQFENNNNDSSGNSHTLTSIGSPTFQGVPPFDPSLINKVAGVQN